MSCATGTKMRKKCGNAGNMKLWGISIDFVYLSVENIYNDYIAVCLIFVSSNESARLRAIAPQKSKFVKKSIIISYEQQSYFHWQPLSRF